MGTQTNIAGNVTGPVLSGKFSGPVVVGGGEAVDQRSAQGAVYKPSGPVKQHFGDRITGHGNVVGDGNVVHVNKSQTTGVTLDEFLRVLSEVRQALPQADLDPDVAEAVTSDVQAVATQAQKPKPNGAIIMAKLNGVLQMLATADGVWGLTEKVREALKAAQSLF